MSRLFEHLDSQIFCHHSCDQNPESIRFYLHAHDKLELFYFISGNVDYIVEGAVYQLTPGDIVITHSAEVHQPIIHPGAPYERISIQFDDALIRDIDSSGLLLKPFWDRSLGCSNLYSFQGRSASGLLPCFEDFDLPSSPEEKRLNIIAVLLRCMLWISHQFETISQAEKYPLADGVASELINYINQELFSKISLATIGQRFFLSKSQINRIFRKATGSSVWEYHSHQASVRRAGTGFSPGSPSTLPQQTAAFRIIPRFIVHMSPAFRSRHRRPYSKTPLSPTQATSTCPDRTASHKASDLMNHNHRPCLISDMLLL